MARIRTVKPEFFRDRKLSECSVSAQLTFIGLWCAADDEGRYLYEPGLLKADVWPLQEGVLAGQVAAFVKELTRVAVVCEYETAGHRYLHVVNWHRHQKINRPTPSRLPACPRITHGVLSEGSPQEVEVEVEQGVSPSASAPRRQLARRAPAANPENAQQLLGWYIDRHGRPVKSVLGQLAKHIKALLDDGVGPPLIQAGLDDFARSDLHPSVLPSLVDARRRGGRPRAGARQRAANGEVGMGPRELKALELAMQERQQREGG